MIDFWLFGGFGNGQTDGRTDGWTFVLLESLLRLKIYQETIVLDGGPDFHPPYSEQREDYNARVIVHAANNWVM